MNPEDLKAYQIKDPSDIFLMHVFLVRSVDDLSSLDTLCQALDMDRKDIDQMLAQASKKKK